MRSSGTTTRQRPVLSGVVTGMEAARSPSDPNIRLPVRLLPKALREPTWLRWEVDSSAWGRRGVGTTREQGRVLRPRPQAGTRPPLPTQSASTAVITGSRLLA